MRHHPILVTVVAVVLLLTATANAAPTDERAAQIDELLELTGLRRSLAQVPELAQMLVQKQAGQLSPSDQARLAEGVARALRWEALGGPVRDALQAGFDPARVSTLLAWLRAPLARRLTDLEVAASSPEAQREIERLAAQLQTSRPPQTRIALIQRLDTASGSADMNVDFMVAIFKTMAETVVRRQGVAATARPGEMDQYVKQLRAQLEQPIRTSAFLFMLYAYRSVSEADLEQYVQFMESDAARWLSRAIRQGLLNAAGGAGGAMGDVVVELTTEARRRTEEEARARLTRDFRVLLEREVALMGKVDAKTPYDQLADEAQKVTEHLEGLKNRYIMELKKEPSDPFVGAVLRASDALGAMFSAWRTEQREAANAAWLRSELETARERLRRDPTASGGEVAQHQHNLQVAARRSAEAIKQHATQWEAGKRLLDEAMKLAPDSAQGR